MREIISIGIGSFGIMTTDNLIQGVAEEHQLNSDSNEAGSGVIQNSYPEIFFDEFQSGKYMARTLLLDADSTAIDTVRAGPGSSNYGLDNYSCGKTGLGSLFAKGHYGEGGQIVDASMEKVRALLERCDAPQGFMVQYGLGGGAGSGMGSLFISKVVERNPDILMSVQTLFPHRQALQSTLEVYNGVLCSHFNVENATLSLPFQNPQLSRYLKNKLLIPHGGGATFEDYNSVIQQALLTFTSPLRFPSTSHPTLRKITTSIIPFPRLMHMTLAFNGFSSSLWKEYTTLDKSKPYNTFINTLEDNQSNLMDVYTRGKILTTYGSFRGQFLESIDLHRELVKYQNKYPNPKQFCEWIDDKHYIAVVKGQSEQQQQGILLQNSCQITKCYRDMCEDFTIQFRRKAHLHYYTNEGMDEMEFTEAESNMNDLISEYAWGLDNYYMGEDDEEEEEE
ncbi:hypothetical protein FGO68_gene9891 [Halteria grandinella]|uniref:Tubulin beta chain n=1 Tax=Halteria grandinella TaxID=5974 RepID=A0A8J8T278_HALGN|nr:hypothetical protein FGO68_gene9891 [Halteria grandinella]